MSDLKENYREAEYADGYTNKHLLIIYNQDNTISFEDTTQYKNTGDYINATQINVTNAAINDLASRYSLWISPYTALPTNLANATFSGRKKFVMNDLGNNKVSFADMTTYSSSGSTYSASTINSANTILNSLQTSFDSGLAAIIQYLHQQGASSNDLNAALLEMESYQSGTGFSAGVATAKRDPHSHNCYTTAELQVYTTENSNLLLNMHGVRDGINGYRQDLAANYNSFVNTINAGKNLADSIVGGMSANNAYYYAYQAMDIGNLAITNENNAVGEYDTMCARFINDLPNV